jgi:hypothetical protein
MTRRCPLTSTLSAELDSLRARVNLHGWQGTTLPPTVWKRCMATRTLRAEFEFLRPRVASLRWHGKTLLPTGGGPARWPGHSSQNWRTSAREPAASVGREGRYRRCSVPFVGCARDFAPERRGSGGWGRRSPGWGRPPAREGPPSADEGRPAETESRHSGWRATPTVASPGPFAGRARHSGEKPRRSAVFRGGFAGTFVYSVQG